MIYDKIEYIGRYRGISKNLDTAIGFIEGTNLNELPFGRTEIDGDKVFANVMEAEAKEEALGQFEIHKKYMDIQIDLDGMEVIQTGLGSATALEAFNETTDFGNVVCESTASCVMGNGRFIICMGKEPHKPGIATLENKHLKKCVIKVAVV